MKKKLFSITTGLLNLSLAFAQVTNSGANIVLSQNTYLVLGDMSIVNNGTFNQTAGTVKFIGSNNNTIAGSTFPRFFNLEINKTGGAQVQLLSRINIAGEILFSSGLLNLNNNNIILTGNAVLNNENENNHIIGTGGYVEASANLTAPNSANPGNLGAIISSPQNLGATTIRRGPQVQTIGSQSSVKRYFDINPSINSLLNATLRFTYLDAELNGLNENTASLWKSTDNINWSEIGFDSRNITSNYVEKIGIADFSHWTLTGTTNPCETMQTFYADADSDGYGNIAVTIQACTSPAGYVSNSDDCNDNNASVYPGAIEVCNDIDDNCNGQINEGCPATPTVSINDVTVYESQRQAVLTVSLSKPAITALKVNFKTIDGSAVKSKDYKNTNGGITIAAGSVSALITIPIMQDNINEGPEYFDVQISLPKVNGQQQAATISDDMGRVTILNGVAPALTKTSSGNTDSKKINNIQSEKFDVSVAPNPGQSDFMIQVESISNKPIYIRIFDVQGRLVKQLQSISSNIRFGSELRPGVYMVEVRQHANKKSMKLVKL